MRFKNVAAILVAVTMASSAAFAEDAASRLGKDLTLIGAEAGANKDGSIPAWNGGIKTPPEGYKPGMHHPNPFSSDKALFTITPENADTYKDRLTAGHLAMFKAYPTYRMVVYPSHRSASYPDYFNEATKANAATAKLIQDGDSVAGAVIGIPFPVPENGLQVIWNHLLRYRGESVRRSMLEALVYADGTYKYIRFIDEFIFSYSKRGAREDRLNNIIGYFRQSFTAPARFAGTILLIYETLNQVKEPRESWVYNPGQRRVRRAPFFGYDYPSPSADGLRTVDEFDLFNGAPDRYDWKLLGKKEIYVPYNSYELHADSHKVRDILTPHHLNSELTRYELHRVWVVEGTLRKHTRHIFPRRVYYVDEDSWMILAGESYDAAGKLWRVSEAHTINYYEVPTVWTTVEAHYDLPSGRYIAMGLSNETEPYHFNIPLDQGDFTPAALRRAGQR